MTPDPLDDLLTRSAPATRIADPDDLGTMIAAARREARPRRRFALTAGAVAGLLLVGTAGVAVATDGFSWTPWLSDPIGEYALTLPSGLDCTVRIAHYTSVDTALADDVNRIVEEWWRSGDVAAEAAALTPAMIDRIRAAENSVFIAETGETVPGGYGTEWYDADREYHFAFADAIGELEHAVLAEHGYTTEDFAAAGLEGGYGIQCLDENGKVTIP
jgi:hypothetical protein